jgi:hydroxymethylpyrimidine pyrophosphatase-like HAD family hydrolase
VTETLIVADVDGTLVDDAGIAYPDLEQLRRLGAEPGHGIALASARPPWSVQRIAASLGPAVRWLSAFQGAIGRGLQARDGGWRELWTVPIEADLVDELDVALDPELARWWYTAGTWTVSRVDDRARAESRIVDEPWTAVTARPPTEPVLKLLAVGEPARVAAAARTVTGARAAVSKPFYLEIVSGAVDADKGIGRLRALVPETGRVVALGDGPNDIGMLRAADLAFTFADAPDEVIEAASAVLSADRSRAYGELVQRLAATP